MNHSFIQFICLSHFSPKFSFRLYWIIHSSRLIFRNNSNNNVKFILLKLTLIPSDITSMSSIILSICNLSLKQDIQFLLDVKSTIYVVYLFPFTFYMLLQKCTGLCWFFLHASIFCSTRRGRQKTEVYLLLPASQNQIGRIILCILWKIPPPPIGLALKKNTIFSVKIANIFRNPSIPF